MGGQYAAMSSVSSISSTYAVTQAQAREQTMATVALKQQASQEQAVADMLLAATETSKPPPAPPGQGLAVDLSV